MAPVNSNLTFQEERQLLNSLQSHHPSLQVDMMMASPGAQEGENFMSVVTKVDVVAHDMENGEVVDLRLIMKRLPQSLGRRETFNVDAAFSNETAFYRTVMPCLEQETKLPFPPCLHASPQLIILRHLRQDGFLMADRRSGLDLQHCELVMQELGIFHALSLALKYLRPERFAKISSTVKEIFVCKDNLILDACVDNCIHMALAVASDIDSPAVKTLRAARGRAFQVLSPHVTPSGPLAVICHGDVWSNNLLFRYYPENPETPSNVCFLDLQCCRCASLALDILYFLFTSSRPGVARQHFRQLIAVYHRALENHLNLVAPLAAAVTLDGVMAELKQHAVCGLILSLLTLPVVTAEDVVVNLDDVTEEFLQSQSFQQEATKGLMNAEYEKRVNENFEVFTLQCLI